MGLCHCDTCAIKHLAFCQLTFVILYIFQYFFNSANIIKWQVD